MEKNQYKLCVEVLRRLDSTGVLQDMVLIGSWCLPFYKQYFTSGTVIPSIKTRDIDFLVPKPGAIRSKADIFQLIKDLGFVKDFRGREGYIILEHPDLAIEFLVPEKGKGTDKPVPLPRFGLNAQAMRFMELLVEDTIEVKIEGILIRLPHPVNFALHKLIISRRRGQKDKAEKDRDAGIKLLKALIDQNEDKRIKKVIDSMPPKRRKAVLEVLESAEDKLLKF